MSEQIFFSIRTLGCKVNQYESEKIKESLLEKGFAQAIPNGRCDLYIINTCTITSLADRKSRQKIRQALAVNPEARIIATGCAVVNRESLQDLIHENIIIIPNSDKQTISEKAAALFPELTYRHNTAKPGRNRNYIKTGDGCESFCSYCIVPFVRGPLTSRPSSDIIKEAARLIDTGSKEIILTAIHLGEYGKGLESEKTNLALLLSNIAEKHPQIRFRLSSIEPMDFSNELLLIMKNNSNICRHLHLPLQHGSNRILKKMNRMYTAEEYENIASNIKKELPDATLTTDIITGFPGETEEDFQETINICRKIRFLKCHIFKYSKREGTAAALMPQQVSEAVKHKRSNELIKICTEISEELHKEQIGKTLRVLVEELSDGLWTGFSDTYIRIHFESKENMYNKFAYIKAISFDGEKLLGDLASYC